MMIDKSDLFLLEGDDGGGFKQELLGGSDSSEEVLSLSVVLEVLLGLVLLEENIDSFLLLDPVDLVLDHSWLFPGGLSESFDQGLGVLDVLGLDFDECNNVDVVGHKICAIIINLPPYVEH
jgi:hypothetical protein